MRIIPRSEWGARYGDGRYWTDLPATEMWLHHSVTIAPDLLPPFDDDDAAIRTIEDIGADRFGQVYGFPYTWGITPVGRIYQGHHVSKTGAHTKGHNTDGRAAVLVGNYHENRPTEAQLDAAAWLLVHAHERGWIAAPQFTGGHRDVSATACPGDHGYAAIGEINRRAIEPPPEEEDVNVLPLVKKAGDKRVWVAVGRARTHLQDWQWDLMEPRAASKIKTLPDDHEFWSYPIIGQLGGAHTHKVEGTAL